MIGRCANSGHTVAGLKLNLLPGGVAEHYVACLALGAGVVADPRKALWEALPLEKIGIPVLKRLLIDERCMISDVSHRILDLAWEDYRVNWESTLVASLLQPDVWRYEVAPWPERVFGGSYPKKAQREERERAHREAVGQIGLGERRALVGGDRLLADHGDRALVAVLAQQGRRGAAGMSGADDLAGLDLEVGQDRKSVV